MTHICDLYLEKIDILFFSFSEIEKKFELTVAGFNGSLKNGIKLIGLGLYLNPGTEVKVTVIQTFRHAHSDKILHTGNVSVPIRSCPRATELIFDHPLDQLEFSQIDGFYATLSVKITGKGSAKTTKDGEQIERTARLKTSMCETAPIKITNCKNSIIGDIYFTSP